MRKKAEDAPTRHKRKNPVVDALVRNPGNVLPLFEEDYDSSISGSNISYNNPSIRTGSSGTSALGARDLIDRTLAGEIPLSIKKLGAVMIFFLCVILALISKPPSCNPPIVVEAVLCRSEISTLQQRQSVIEEYETRLKHSMILFNNVNAYYLTVTGGNSDGYAMAYSSIGDSLQYLTDTNVATRKSFATLHLDYDTYPVVITAHGETMTILFTHAMIKVRRHAIPAHSSSTRESLF